MKKLFQISLLFPIFLLAQENKLDLERNISGVITTSQGVYLVLDEGLMQINKTDLYIEYYRKIYNDSTLINPNTVFNSEFDFNIIPYIIPDTEQQNIDFSEPLKVGLFIQINESGKYDLTHYANTLIDSLNVLKKP